MEHKHIEISSSPTSPQIDYDFYFGKIIPQFIIENRVPKVITYIHARFHLEGFVIKRFNNKLVSVRIIGKHPNADLDTDELCLKEEEEGAVVENIEALKTIIITILETYYFDESHFRPVTNQYKAKPVNDFMKIDVNFEKGEIYDDETPYRQLYPR